MKKISATIFLALFAIVNIAAQGCLPDVTLFETQEQIDNFEANYPDCSEILGYVYIDGDDITNLHGLNMITKIHKSLLIQNNNLLTTLEGLESLTDIGEGLSIGGDFFGLGQGNPELISLTGLDNLSSIGGALVISDNDNLVTLNGLENLKSIDGRLLIGVGWIGDPLGNPALISLEGLDNIDPESISGIEIRNNDNLSNCDIQSICNYLVSINGYVDIINNAPGCNSVEEVEIACDSQGIPDYNQLSFTIHPNPTDNGFITITLDNPKDLHLTCFNTFGQQVHWQEIHSSETMINVSTWTPGIYLAVVYEDGKPVGRSKFVVQ